MREALLSTTTLLLALPIGAMPAAALRLAPLVSAPVCRGLSKTTYAYHSSDDGNGLNRCSHEVKAMPAALAQKLRKRKYLKCW